MKIILVVREADRLKPDYSLDFEVPEIPAVGAYVSITRPDTPEPYSEDVIVRQVWWRLHHPETGTAISSDKAQVGKVVEIFVECDIAEGPYASDDWRAVAQSARERGHEVSSFDVERFCVRQNELRSDY